MARGRFAASRKSTSCASLPATTCSGTSRSRCRCGSSAAARQKLPIGSARACRNSAQFYDAKEKKPAGKREGTLKLGALDPLPAKRIGARRLAFVGLGTAVLGLAAVAIVLRRRRPD